METITLDQFLENANEIIADIVVNEKTVRIPVPGATAAVIISEPQYEYLMKQISDSLN